MAKYTSADIPFVFLDGIDLRGVATGLDDQGIEGDFEEVTPLGSSFRCQQPVGSGTGKISMDVFYDDTPSASPPASSGFILQTSKWMSSGPDRYLNFGIGGNTRGKDFIGTTVKQSTLGRVIEMSKFTKANVDFVVNERRNGLIVADLATRSTAGNTNYIDYGGIPTETNAVMWANITAVTGTPRKSVV